MFQHPFHRKGSVSRATHRGYETHLVHITISSWQLGLDCASRALAVTASSIQCLCVMTVSLHQQRMKEEKERETGEKTCSQTCLCFHFSGIKREASLCYSSDPTWLRNEIKKEKGEMEGSSSPSWCCWGIVYSADKGDIRCLSLLREQCYCWMSQKEQEDSQ